MNNSEDDFNCVKCDSKINCNEESYECDVCLKPVHRNCANLSASEGKCMPLQKRFLMFICNDCKLAIRKIPVMIQIMEGMQKNIELIKSELSKTNEAVQVQSVNGRSYADMVSLSPALTGITVNKPGNIPSIVIKPKKPQDASKTKNALQESIKPADLELGIKSLKTLKDGGVMIKCQSSHDVEKFSKAAKDSLKEGYDIIETKMRKPRIKIAGYGGNSTKESLEECIRKQNNWISAGDNLEIKYIRKKKKWTLDYLW